MVVLLLLFVFAIVAGFVVVVCCRSHCCNVCLLLVVVMVVVVLKTLSAFVVVAGFVVVRVRCGYCCLCLVLKLLVAVLMLLCVCRICCYLFSLRLSVFAVDVAGDGGVDDVVCVWRCWLYCLCLLLAVTDVVLMLLFGLFDVVGWLFVFVAGVCVCCCCWWWWWRWCCYLVCFAAVGFVSVCVRYFRCCL